MRLGSLNALILLAAFAGLIGCGGGPDQGKTNLPPSKTVTTDNSKQKLLADDLKDIPAPTKK